MVSIDERDRRARGMRAVTLALALLFLDSPLPAQSGRHEVVRIADGVYAVLQPTSVEYAANGNTTVVINEADVVVVDATNTPGSAEAVIAEIRRLTSKPVRFLVNTHWHQDHVVGNDAYQRAFPGIEIVAHPFTREVVLSQVTPELEKSRVAYPKLLAELEATLASGQHAQGRPLTDAERATTERRANIYRRYIPEMNRMVIVPPTLTVSENLVLRRGEREIRIQYLGRGNTQGDLIVYLPRERVLVTGDLVVHPIPFSYGSYLQDWPGTLDRLLAFDAAYIVPGHGPVMRDTEHIRTVRGLVLAVMDQTRALVRQGKTLDEIRAAIDIREWRTRLTRGDPVLERSFASVFFTPATERAYMQARGEAQ